jgi:hypothetical protein
VYYKISKTDEAKKITLNEKVNTASYYIAAAIAVFLIIIILAALSFEVVASILMFCFFIFIISMISIFPLLIILILQSYDLIKTVICVAVIETVVFWAFLFTPFYAALFIR